MKWLGLNGVGQLPNPAYAATIPALVFMAYQGMFAGITPALITGANGLFFGDASLLGKQALAVAACIIYSFVATTVILRVIDALIGLRVSPEDENVGLDLSQHSEVGYVWHD